MTLLALSACTETSSHAPNPPSDPPGPTCIEGTPKTPEIGVAQSSKLPASHLWINVDIATKQLIKQINQQLPQPLAQEKDRPVGAPGNASFKVTHGTPSLRNEKSGIQVRLPINADISVCKPLGSSCLRYGQCEPAFDARFSFQTLWDENYRTDAPRGSISATKKCVIGLDVTSQIEKIAQDEVAGVERQMAKQWPNTKQLVRNAWGELKAPLEVMPQTCMHFSPESLSYSQLKLSDKGDSLVGTLGLTGQLILAESCTKKQKLPSVPAPITHQADSEESRLFIPQAVSNQSIEQALHSSLTGSWGESASNQVKVNKVIFGDNQVALLVHAAGEICGNVWIWGHLTYRAAGNLLQFELDGHSDTGAIEESSAPFLNYLRTRGQIPLPGPAWVNAARAEELIEEMKGKLPPELKVQVTKLELPSADVHVSDNGYTVLHQVNAQLAITDLKLPKR